MSSYYALIRQRKHEYITYTIDFSLWLNDDSIQSVEITPNNEAVIIDNPTINDVILDIGSHTIAPFHAIQFSISCADAAKCRCSYNIEVKVTTNNGDIMIPICQLIIDK